MLSMAYADNGVWTEAINEGRKAHFRDLLIRIGFPQ
jgi:hypothetical protein